MSEAVLQNVKQSLEELFRQPVEIKQSTGRGGGCINHATRLETNVGIFFLKWNGKGPSDLFDREAEGLSELAGAADSNLHIPQVIASKNIGSTPGFLLMEYLETSNVSSGKNDEALGRGLAAIHRCKGAYFGFRNDNYCGATPQNNTPSGNWPTFFRDQRLHYLLQLIDKKQGLSVHEKKIYGYLLERIPDLLPESTCPALIHGDLWSGNYLFTTNGPALIDPAAYFAEREMEFGMIVLFGGFSRRFFDAYNESFPLLADWQERTRLYQLYHLLNHYYLFGGSYGSQALSIARSYHAP